ncbi:hypothetical protein GCM10023083_09100 [Streptomyces phyllanthi]
MGLLTPQASASRASVREPAPSSRAVRSAVSSNNSFRVAADTRRRFTGLSEPAPPMYAPLAPDPSVITVRNLQTVA